MQATMELDRRKGASGGRLVAGFSLAVAAAVALGFGVGYFTAPAGHATPAITVVSAPDTSEGGRPATHGELP